MSVLIVARIALGFFGFVVSGRGGFEVGVRMVSVCFCFRESLSRGVWFFLRGFLVFFF